VKALRFAELALLGFGYVMTPILLRDDATGALGVYLAVTSRGGGTQVFRLPLDRNT